MSKYKVLFHRDSLDKSDDSINIGADMLFGYLEEWTYDTFEEAYGEAIDNDYRPKDFTIVKTVDYKVSES